MKEIALIGKKIGMSREFFKSGQSVPVTVVKMEKGRIVEIIDSKKNWNEQRVFRLRCLCSSNCS